MSSISKGLPVAVSKGLHIAGVTQDKKIFTTHISTQDKPWAPVPPPPADVIAPPTLLAYRGALFLFVVGVDSKIYYNMQAFAGVWSGWTMIPDGTTRGSVAAVVYRDLLHIFVLGDDGHIYMKILKETWSEWQNILGPWQAASAPAATVVNNKLAIVFRGNTCQIFFLEFDGDQWGAIAEIPGGFQTTETLATTCLPNNSLLVVMRGLDDRVFEQVRTADGTWLPSWHEFHPNSLITAAPALGVHGPNAVLYVRSGYPGILLLSLTRDTATGSWTQFAPTGPLGALAFAVGTALV